MATPHPWLDHYADPKVFGPLINVPLEDRPAAELLLALEEALRIARRAAAAGELDNAEAVAKKFIERFPGLRVRI